MNNYTTLAFNRYFYGNVVGKPITFVILSKGTGAGVQKIQLQVTKDITLTVDGTARFYDNAAGTINPTTRRTAHADGWQVFYLKVPSGTSNLTFSDENKVKYWGSTNWIEYGYWNDGWEGLTANHPCLTGNLLGFTKLKSFYIAGNNTFSFNLNTISHLTELEEFSVDDDLASFKNTVFGDVVDLPRSLKLMLLIGNTVVGGKASDLPPNMKGIILYGANTLSGAINDISKRIKFFYIAGLNTLSGNISDFGPDADDFLIQGNNTINNYTGKVWPKQMFAFVFTPVGAGGLDAAEVDALFNDLALSTFGVGYVMTITGTNAAPTVASLVARNSIIAQGVVLSTN